MDKKTFNDISEEKKDDNISDESTVLEAEDEDMILEEDEDMVLEDEDDSVVFEDEDDSRAFIQEYEYETVGAGTIVLIAFIILSIIAIGIALYTSKNNGLNEKTGKVKVVKEKEKKSKYNAKKEVKKDVELNLKSFISEKEDEVGILVEGDLEAKLSGITINKSGDSKKMKMGEVIGDNAGMVITKNARVVCTNLKINTEGNGSSGIYVEDSDENQSIVNGTIETEGEQAPAIYTMGKISLESTNVVSKCAEGMILEGMADVNMSISEVENQVAIYGAKKLKGTTIYMLGKGEKTDSVTSFKAKTSTINSYGGNIFDVENTKGLIDLEDCTFDNDKKSIFLEAQRKAHVVLTATNQNICGIIKSDGSSKLDIRLTKGSTLKGAINIDDSECDAKLTLDKTSKLILTNDCYLREFSNELKNNVNIETNGFKIYVNRKEISLK